MPGMALTESRMLPLGSVAPDFTLPEPRTGEERTLHELAADAPATLVMFMCNHCPYVQHVLDPLIALANEYTAKGVAVVAINSNDVETYPQDGPEAMASLAAEKAFAFPFLLDEDQSVARAYQAACTPDFFLFDGDRNLAYRGQLDASRPGNGIPVTGADLRAALDAVLSGGAPTSDQKPSVGCNIKWKPGNEPR